MKSFSRLNSKRQLKKLVIALITSLLIIVWNRFIHRDWIHNVTTAVNEQAPLVNGMYRVTEVDDGDTIVVDMNGTLEKVRFIGVDTPEVKDPRKPVQCYGWMASTFSKNRIGSGPVRLEADPLNTNRDRYNRLLRYVYLTDGTFMNAELIKEGYGFAYTSFPFTKISEFEDYQKQAKQAEKGVWGECRPERNQYGGYTSNPEQ